ncbi:DUF4291 domain-containing protein [Acanthopleuribacter pedis]|uniref:DUF4291 domain-containing protein n=1 Tax=Acanthopleuribacter pedis TaxID=442870 RepID=A0A8J7QBX5_9BACT|nr:DUF4291 domain-containing protein [Acanthopleuribacter pedis]MBO1322801.1 DUF4291 domain-containing protein [Acanthopleuribacter pedis]
MDNYRQIRAQYDADTIRVYQAYNHTIADAALAAGTFQEPPFKKSRMTWIKPSFLWMMYRAGWGRKDQNQTRILAIDITRVGFDWALAEGCLSHYVPAIHGDEDRWRSAKGPVRIQWDPERGLKLQPLEYRAIQIGLRGRAVGLYVHDWIRRITDVTAAAQEIEALVLRGDLDGARALLPEERDYPVADDVRKVLGMDLGDA